MTGTTDPASLAATAAILRRLATDTGDLAHALSARPDPGTPRSPSTVRGAVHDLGDVAAVLADVARQGSQALTRAAYGRSRTLHERCLLEEQAALAGLSGGSQGYAVAPGIAGVADPAAVRSRDRTRARIRAEEESLITQTRVQAQALRSVLAELTVVASEVAEALR